MTIGSNRAFTTEAMTEFSIWPKRGIKKEHLFIAILVSGLLAFAGLALWDLHNYLRLAGYVRVIQGILPAPAVADPDRRKLAVALISARELYQTSRLVLLFSLVAGVGVGAAVVVLVAGYFRGFRKAEEDLLQAFFALAESIEERDSETGRHCASVRSLSIFLGRDFGLNSAQLLQLTLGAQLHDLGKIAVPDSILLKPGSLSEEELVKMRTHAQVGANIIERIQRFSEAAAIVRHHHERFDGSGYPGGLAGKEIPVGARIVAAVDAFLAMTHDRPYRRAIPQERALLELEAEAGCQFDPEVVRGLKRLLLVAGNDRSETKECGKDV